MLVKGGRLIEAPAAVRVMALDKTGTLTTGRPVVAQVIPFDHHDEHEGDAESLRLEPAAGVSEASHGHYTARPGTPLAVLSLSYLPPAPAGQTYQAWVLVGGAWHSLGLTPVDAGGHALMIVEGADLGVAGAVDLGGVDRAGRRHGARGRCGGGQGHASDRTCGRPSST